MPTTELKPNTTNLSREEYKEQAQAHLDKLDAQLEELAARGRKAEAEAKINYTSFIDELKTQRAAVEQRIQELQEATDEAWATMEYGFESAWRELTRSFEKALKHYQ